MPEPVMNASRDQGSGIENSETLRAASDAIFRSGYEVPVKSKDFGILCNKIRVIEQFETAFAAALRIAR